MINAALLIGLALAARTAAAPSPSARTANGPPAVELGQTPDQVRSGLGRPDHASVAVEPGRDVEVWSYDQSYRWFWLECDQCAPQSAAGRTEEARALACRERLRVVFVNGRVAAFLARD